MRIKARAKGSFLTILLACLICLQCSQKTTEPEPKPDGPVRTPAQLTANELSLVQSCNRFGLKLFGEVAGSESEETNLFVSPLSVSYALAMTYNGAAGDTRDSMAKTLELSGMSIQEVNEAYSNLTDILTSADESVTMQIANSIWSREGKAVKQPFVDLNRTYFDALVRSIDFGAAGSADTINQWVRDNTNGKIEEIIGPSIPGNVVMLLMNAVYFKGGWTRPFDTALTFGAPFYRADGSSIQRDFMMMDTSGIYYEHNLFQAVLLEFGWEGFAMTLMLPKAGVTMDAVVAEFNESNWSSWQAGFEEIPRLMFQMPKFKFEYEAQLKEALRALGMGIAFDAGKCDLSNIFEDGDGWIDQVKHKSFIQVDETGAEGAAVTVVVVVTSMPPAMVLNRPFLFVIHERDSGAILFIGKVADPVWED
jgi:serpin B